MGRFIIERNLEISHKQNALTPVSMLHTGDLHLPGSFEETDLVKTKSYKSPFKALEALVDKANLLKVDLVLFAGDLFDTYHPSEEVVSFVLSQFERLTSMAVLIPGNHDCLGPTQTYLQPAWREPDKGLYTITDTEGELFKVPGLPVVIWARPMVEHTPDYQPLDGMPIRNGGNWNIVLAHGFFYDEGKSGFRSSPIHAHQIRESGWDYIALGHLHRFVDVSQGEVKAAYAGSPIISWNPEADVLLVTLDAGKNDPVSFQKQPIY